MVLPSEQPSPEPCAELFTSGEAFDAMQEWFGLDPETRSGAIDEAIVSALKSSEVRWRSLMRSSEGLSSSQHWMLSNLAALVSPTVEKIFTIDQQGTELTEEDFRSLWDGSAGVSEFMNRVDRLEEENEVAVDIFPEADDFAPASNLFLFTLPVKEMGKLLKYLAEYLPSDHRFFGVRVGEEALGYVHYSQIVPPIRCVDLISDDELMTHLPNAEEILRLNSLRFSDWMEQFLAQGLYPEVKTLERLIERHPAESAAEAPGHSISEPIPLGAHYHALLRRVNHLEVQTPQPGIRPHWTQVELERFQEIAQRTADYLLSDVVMQTYLPYLNTTQSWDDILISPASGGLLYTNDETVAEGEEAVLNKQREFGQTVRTIYETLLAIGDVDKANTIANREINGIKFANFLESTA